MAVDEDVWIHSIEELNQCACFRSFEFDEVAIEVQSCWGLTQAHAVARSNLSGSMVRAEPIVGVRAVVRDDVKFSFLEPWVVWRLREGPQELQNRLFASALSRVNIADQNASQAVIIFSR